MESETKVIIEKYKKESETKVIILKVGILILAAFSLYGLLTIADTSNKHMIHCEEECNKINQSYYGIEEKNCTCFNITRVK